ncbi:hypothetical protein GY976_23735, partial [Escherichia coli]|nr:hypothetical protein [Escherichia coli]
MDDQTVLVPELKGVVFVNGIAAVRPVTDMPGGLAAPDLPLLQTPEFAARVRSYLGRPLTRAGLNAIARLVRDAYRAAEQPFLEVS